MLRWVDPNFNESKYDNIVYNPITYYPVPKPTTQVGQQVLDKLLSYTNTQMKTALAKRKPLVTTPGSRSLIFRGAITGVATSKEGLQFYEVVPVALLVAGTQMATGHRTMDTHLFFEGELIDAATNKPVIKVVRQGEGKDLNNESTPMAFETLKKVVDDMATDASMFDVNKNNNNEERTIPDGAFFYAARRRYTSLPISVSGRANITRFPSKINTNPTIALTCQTYPSYNVDSVSATSGKSSVLYAALLGPMRPTSVK
ncbi:Uncharacterized membrane lipoprotein clustered with tellurite resistance proteins TehA/TehB [Citrobacter freundii]|uniref:Uncharacterized membrane lipoprotein clustered with tellurite resistance proteins TehA/TehB n=2 Tax=Enterobacteriaceae TaxID=543 RepID=A0A7G2ITH7_CITFR|nr:Uncharacterized membrane lipoprotein clustered with tellurite resistance proteins TehA/TehB [Citrobacter freundii]